MRITLPKRPPNWYSVPQAEGSMLEPLLFNSIFNNRRLLLTTIHRSRVNSGGYFTERRVNIHHFHRHWQTWIIFSLYTTQIPREKFISFKIPKNGQFKFKTREFVLLLGSELFCTWQFTSELAYQRARKTLLTCVVFTKTDYSTSRM